MSVAPASIPTASALQPSLGLREKVGRGKLLGGGERVNATEPENFCKSKLLPNRDDGDDNKTLEISFEKSLGSGPIRLVESIITHSDDFAVAIDFIGLTTNGFDFFGVRD